MALILRCPLLLMLESSKHTTTFFPGFFYLPFFSIILFILTAFLDLLSLCIKRVAMYVFGDV
jgi:hypothetical protein